MSYGYDTNWSNFIFISTPEDLKKELKIEDVDKELFFLTKHAFCETCNKTLKAFASDDKAQAKVDKHIATKKYAGHKALVKTVDFSEFRKCTTADIAGTKANIERNNQLRDSYYGAVRGQIRRVIESNPDIITNIQKTFGFTETKNEIPECPKTLADGYVYFSNERAQGKLKVSEFDNARALFNGTWGTNRQEPRHSDLHDRASMLMHYMGVDGLYRFDNKVYSWDYPINYDSFVGHDTEPAGDCHFCTKKIESWNNLFDGGHISNEYVHRDCYKHYQELKRLESYAERYAEEQKKIAQEVVTS